MIDLRTETVIPLAEAPAHMPGRPHHCSVWRWRTKGVRGRVLESFALGGKIFTSLEAIERFAQHRGGNDAPTIRTPAARERAIRKAEEELADAGI